jgi:AcrR family transcriptional regulator
MTELSPAQRSGITRRNNSRNAFLEAAEAVFADSDYLSVRVEHVASHAGVSAPTFYNIFPRKSAWAAAVLDQRVNQALDKRTSTAMQAAGAPRDRILDHLGLLAAVSMPMPMITKSLVDERAEGELYSDLLPCYYGELTVAFAAGQRWNVFRSGVSPSDIANFALDSIATACAMPLASSSINAKLLPSLVLDGFTGAV